MAQTSSLPRWNLEKRFGFESPYDTKIDAQLADLEKDAAAFKAKFEGQLGTSLKDALETYEELNTRRGALSAYQHLAYDINLEDDALKKRKGEVSQKLSAIVGNSMEWMDLDLAELDASAVEKQPEAAKFKSYIENAQKEKPHNLTKDVERALTVRSPYAGKSPAVQFYDNELALLRFSCRDLKEVNMEVLLSKLSSSTDAAFRAELMKTFNEGLKGHMARVAALSLNMVAGSRHIEQQERKFATLRSSRNLSNNVPDNVVESLLLGVREHGVPLAKRFYKLKKGILKSTQGLERFTWSDRNAPIDIGAGEEKPCSWGEAVEIVDQGYRKFSPSMADMFQSMVKEERIDVPATDGKKGGAYCHGVVPGIGPFQLLNFDGTKRDVATLAHESGHGCHDILAYGQGTLQYHPPLTLAETASIFGEMIVFRDLLAKCETPKERLQMLIQKIDDVVNSVVRQCSFDYFEEQAHAGRAKGELSVDELNAMWTKATKEYYGEEGEVFDSFENSEMLWSYVPHFHHVPFYVYSYAFADLVVGSLYQSYRTTPDGFEDRLLDLLRAGSTKNFVDALAPFGLQPDSPKFWGDALNAHLGGLLEEAEKLAKEIGYVE